MITAAERRFPIRIRIAVPPQGLGQRHSQITAWLGSLAHSRNHCDPAPILPHVDVQGDCGRQPHGAAHASRSHQPACEVVSAIGAWRRSGPADARVR
jgi:hypothetical protein